MKISFYSIDLLGRACFRSWSWRGRTQQPCPSASGILWTSPSLLCLITRSRTWCWAGCPPWGGRCSPAGRGPAEWRCWSSSSGPGQFLWYKSGDTFEVPPVPEYFRDERLVVGAVSQFLFVTSEEFTGLVPHLGLVRDLAQPARHLVKVLTNLSVPGPI